MRRNLVIEATYLGYFEPYTEKEICSFVGKMMMDNQQIDIAKIMIFYRSMYKC
ncbi:hypothetical protein QJU89_09095 [Pasteurella skyensis]|uniref:Uncharacterized protein n=1 Tax=Phocoenobacter skyensis TaxID=97481 RepID=A0AAJ6P1A6_9PAST|nr:hypothetical protein [Pasteurella skyensis]MDP8163336.1 hypothetical protein [Pasteurella skyensis]MDP8173537.1 hypothetical protein [Pasteurella skyensis]MDP8179734.1 hypothetical protein [Pasteurella skyensis]MDP8183848.1 hypothetical protein [Pasteurella skyensis]MDP8190093.1 hypothetical protein [Pasteurella skyensis]